jgi:hypothetical protein
VAERKAILVLRLRELDFLRYGNSRRGAALELVYVAGAQQLNALAPTERTIIAERDADGPKFIVHAIGMA